MYRRTSSSPWERPVHVTAGQATLGGVLGIPPNAKGIILFAHGSGSGRLSPRNNFVAHVLQEGGFATLLVDLLTEDEAEDQRFVFDIDLLADRLLHVTRWLKEGQETKYLKVGYFGASTGAGAALQAAARAKTDVWAIVSRGGRPDLAMNHLPQVEAPTLLIVGGSDQPVIPLNQVAYGALRCEKELVVIPGATHLFEEPGALEKVAQFARRWFDRQMGLERRAVA
jgi:putative phosphoribosyl transferase